MHSHPIYPDLTALHGFQTIDATQQGAFARTRAADDGNDLALLNIQVNVLQHSIAAIAFDDRFQFNEGHDASFPVPGCTE